MIEPTTKTYCYRLNLGGEIEMGAAPPPLTGVLVVAVRHLCPEPGRIPGGKKGLWRALADEVKPTLFLSDDFPTALKLEVLRVAGSGRPISEDLAKIQFLHTAQEFQWDGPQTLRVVGQMGGQA